MLNGLDLFSGIGGLSIALSEWVRPIAYCEIDPYCQGILLSRQLHGHIYDAPIWDDIRTFKGEMFIHGEARPDIIYGGFPCQDISVAGNGKGLAGERSGLFWEVVRLAKEIKPKFIFLENVPAILIRGASSVVQAITEMGYDCRWCIISAASVGARHKRERWFLLAHAKHNGSSSLENGKGTGLCDEKRRNFIPKDCGKVERAGLLSTDVANSGFICARCLQESGKEERSSFHAPGCNRFWEVEPDVGRVADGIPFRVDRLRALGNAVVPIQAKEAFKILMDLKLNKGETS